MFFFESIHRYVILYIREGRRGGGGGGDGARELQTIIARFRSVGKKWMTQRNGLHLALEHIDRTQSLVRIQTHIDRTQSTVRIQKR